MKATNVTTEKKAYVPELAGLDLLRFLLAIAVLLVHYFFFYDRPNAPEATTAHQPFTSVLSPIYQYGGNVVQIFWMLSGFIFQTIYFRKIASHSLSLKDYLILRLSRLYPLHILTLFTVAALQITYFHSTGRWFWFNAEDMKHFFLQVFFMASWYPSFKLSFNAPIWSVSIELFVYIIFFIVTAAGIVNKRNLYLITFLSVVFTAFKILDPFSRCMMFFFAGCIVAEHMREGTDAKTLLFRTTALCVPTLVAFFAMKKLDPGMTPAHLQLLLDILLVPGSSAILLAFIVVFRDLKTPWVISAFKQLGDLTYSTYLVHFPIILSIVLILKPKDLTIYDKPMMLFMYVAVSLVVGWLAYRYYEKPVQVLLRKRYERKKRKTFSMTPERQKTATHAA
jgi:peptidoglycan/LPS O-acetylase OafA/YrhL